MHWNIPAKTFLIGEYAALHKQSAILLTTKPYFELKQIPSFGLHGIHPDSPAGRWWTQMDIKNLGLEWLDPYQGRGGMGASSAQFVSVYQACAAHRGVEVDQTQLLNDYQKLIQTDDGVLASGYDILAQFIQAPCIYINREMDACQRYNWPFEDIGYILIHTGEKLATHKHLQTLDLSQSVANLTYVVEHAKRAFDTHSSQDLIEAINTYHTLLTDYGWVAPHSLSMIERLKSEIDLLAIKGCGAMGADVLLLIAPKTLLKRHLQILLASQWTILANSL